MANVSVNISKGKGAVSVDTDAFSEEIYAKIFTLGLETYLNKNMSKIKTKDLEGAELEAAQQAALEQANKNHQALLDGKFGRQGKAKGTSGAVMTEARRLAKNLVKDEIKRAGQKVSHYENAEITKWANELIVADPSIVKMAEASLEQRKAKTVKLDISKIAISDKKIKAGEVAKAKKKAEAAANPSLAAKRKPQQLNA